MIELTQKIEILMESYIKDYFDNILAIPQDEQFPIFKTSDGGTEEDCGEGIKIIVEDIGMLDGAEGTSCNIRQCVLLVGLYQPVTDGDDGLGFSKMSHKLRRRIEDNIYSILRTLGDGQDTDMYLFYAEKREIGQGISIDGLEEGTWHSAGTWILKANGEENDFDACQA